MGPPFAVWDLMDPLAAFGLGIMLGGGVVLAILVVLRVIGMLEVDE